MKYKMIENRINTSKKQQIIQNLLADLPLKISWWKKTTSTNSMAKKDLAVNGFSCPKLIGSDTQSAGYGKSERPFISNKGGIYLSLTVKVPQLSGQNLGLLTTGIAWQLHETIKHELHINTKLKWVNDILFHGKKIAGILVENPAPKVAIIGIGCNLYQPQLNKKIATAANLLDSPLSTEQTCHFVATLVRKLLNFIPNYTNGNFLPEYEKNLVLLQQDVTLQVGQQTFYGKVLGLSPEANLILQIGEKVQVFNAGEITKVRQGKLK